MQAKTVVLANAGTRIHVDLDKDNRPVLLMVDEMEEFRLLSAGASPQEVTRIAFALVAAARDFLLFAGQYEQSRTLRRAGTRNGR
jgi:hypothetical protein